MLLKRVIVIVCLSSGCCGSRDCTLLKPSPSHGPQIPHMFLSMIVVFSDVVLEELVGDGGTRVRIAHVKSRCIRPCARPMRPPLTSVPAGVHCVHECTVVFCGPLLSFDDSLGSCV